MIKSKAFLVHWVMNNLKNVSSILSVFAEPIRQDIYMASCSLHVPDYEQVFVVQENCACNFSGYVASTFYTRHTPRIHSLQL